jgi:signal transduction histidine kinase
MNPIIDLLPRTLFGRLVLLMATGLISAQLIGATLHLAERQRTISTTVSYEFAQRVAAVYRAVDTQRGDERSHLAELLSTPRQILTVVENSPVVAESSPVNVEFLARVREVLGHDIEIHPAVIPQPGTFAFDLYLHLKAGGWLRIQGSAPTEVFAWPVHHLLTIGVMLTMVLILVWLVVRMTVRPLTQLASAAHGLGEDLKRPPLSEDGPAEVREAAQAFNAMQRRIRSGIEERERFLAAVSHDLKTPVTRLRLRSELLENPDLRERFVRDLDEMQGMLGSALDFLQGKATDEAIQPLDLTALVESMVDDYVEVGHVVHLQAPEALRIAGRPQALRRAIGNLIDNALKYGSSAAIRITKDAHCLQIIVDDEGPGLPEAELDQVFEPFYRLEYSRNRETGGVGLGLAIVRQIVRGHGGEVVLTNRTGGGLRAVLELPGH